MTHRDSGDEAAGATVEMKEGPGRATTGADGTCDVTIKGVGEGRTYLVAELEDDDGDTLESNEVAVIVERDSGSTTTTTTTTRRPDEGPTTVEDYARAYVVEPGKSVMTFQKVVGMSTMLLVVSFYSVLAYGLLGSIVVLLSLGVVAASILLLINNS